jgi:hypothetical protein
MGLKQMRHAGLAVLALVVCGCGLGGETDRRANTLPVPDRTVPNAPGDAANPRCNDFSYSLIGGGTASLADYAGKYVLIYATSYT